ncbi:hypothetical protein [Actinoplanes sp. NPDC051859]|uniref:hypothetical protein n=1 Tax=Actinoplanes sp. NPDC051859 TaxID=3363909 RepID=UPI003792DD7D
MPHCGVHPGPDAVDDPIKFDDTFDVPVFVKHSSPMDVQGRPRPSQVASAAAPWPSRGLPKTGSYRVTTSWRAILHAAITVGRDVSPWLAHVPHLAGHEILSRCAPLQAYLRRIPVACLGPDPRYALVPNEVYSLGTEVTAKGAFSYRIGMTMAEWLCWGQIGMSHSVHAESTYPLGVDPADWDERRNKPDLVGMQSLAPSGWLIEAKGERRLSKTKLREGAAQLDLDGLIDGSHRRVLCGTSIEDRVFMTLDIDTRYDADLDLTATDPDPMAGPDVSNDDDALYQLARASMLIYLVLREAEQTSIVPVGVAADRRGPAAQVGGSGAVTLLERDWSTSSLRDRMRRTPSSRRLPKESGIDMLTAAVPGTGMTVGLSRRVYAACSALLGLETDLARRAEQEANEAAARLWRTTDGAAPDEDPPLRQDTTAVEERISVRYHVVWGTTLSPSAPGAEGAQWVPRTDVRSEYERIAYNRLQQDHQEELLVTAREAFRSADSHDWESVAARDSPLTIDGPPRQLESATADTYLAINPALIV